MLEWRGLQTAEIDVDGQKKHTTEHGFIRRQERKSFVRLFLCLKMEKATCWGTGGRDLRRFLPLGILYLRDI
jgi:hypothetical protein